MCLFQFTHLNLDNDIIGCNGLNKLKSSNIEIKINNIRWIMFIKNKKN